MLVGQSFDLFDGDLDPSNPVCHDVVEPTKEQHHEEAQNSHENGHKKNKHHSHGFHLGRAKRNYESDNEGIDESDEYIQDGYDFARLHY